MPSSGRGLPQKAADAPYGLDGGGHLSPTPYLVLPPISVNQDQRSILRLSEKDEPGHGPGPRGRDLSW